MFSLVEGFAQTALLSPIGPASTKAALDLRLRTRVERRLLAEFMRLCRFGRPGLLGRNWPGCAAGRLRLSLRRRWPVHHISVGRLHHGAVDGPLAVVAGVALPRPAAAEGALDLCLLFGLKRGLVAEGVVEGRLVVGPHVERRRPIDAEGHGSRNDEMSEKTIVRSSLFVVDFEKLGVVE
jgi:hypothetical protein